MKVMKAKISVDNHHSVVAMCEDGISFVQFIVNEDRVACIVKADGQNHQSWVDLDRDSFKELLIAINSTAIIKGFGNH